MADKSAVINLADIITWIESEVIVTPSSFVVHPSSASDAVFICESIEDLVDLYIVPKYTGNSPRLPYPATSVAISALRAALIRRLTEEVNRFLIMPIIPIDSRPAETDSLGRVRWNKYAIYSIVPEVYRDARYDLYVCDLDHNELVKYVVGEDYSSDVSAMADALLALDYIEGVAIDGPFRSQTSPKIQIDLPLV